MLRKTLLILVCFMLVLSLCGCDFVKTDMAELFSPPSLTGDFKYISKSLKIPRARVIHSNIPSGARTVRQLLSTTLTSTEKMKPLPFTAKLTVTLLQ